MGVGLGGETLRIGKKWKKKKKLKFFIKKTRNLNKMKNNINRERDI